MKQYNKFKKIAEKLFVSRKYEKALFNYSIALKNSPKDKEARLGAILSDLAMENEDEAQALFDYYTAIKEEKTKDATGIIENILDSLDDNINTLSQIVSQTFSQKIDNIDGISYEDFLSLVKTDGFNRAFEAVMYSTKVIISNKDDFFEFIELLVKNNFTEIALSYIEGASSAYYYDERLQQLIDNLKKQS